MKFKSKVQTLIFLNKLNLQFYIPDFFSIKVLEFQNNEDFFLEEIFQRFKGKLIAVRSSSHSEDGEFSSNAGKFLSLLNIDSSRKEDVRNSIREVLASYLISNLSLDEEEFFVQLMLDKTTASGVIFTHDLNNGAPYYVINYDDISGLTNTVTSGGGNFSNKILLIHRSQNQLVRSNRFQSLLSAINDLEKKIECQFLDIEFALGEFNEPYLLQVRQITTRPNWNRAITNKVDNALAGIQEFLTHKFIPANDILGRHSVFGQMPDWNPIEMLGKSPKALSYSLYEELITRSAWSEARYKLGYGRKIKKPLMVSLCGQPYIDVRLSFNSFLPPNIDDKLGEKIVNSWLDQLIESPALHDKIEFDVAISNYCFDIDERLRQQLSADITESEKNIFKSEMLELTNKLLLEGEEYSISHLLSQISALVDIQNSYAKSSNIEDLSLMISDCIEFGITPFAMLARHGFIAKSILESMIKVDLLSNSELETFYLSFNTIAGELVKDMGDCAVNQSLKESFLNKYGHLRPGTYNILSKRYDQMPDFQFKPVERDYESIGSSFSLSDAQSASIDRAFLDHNFKGVNSLIFFEYAKNAIRGREWAKFVFTKSVSEILELIARFGESIGLNREELAHIEVQDFLSLSIKSNNRSIEEYLRDISHRNSQLNELSRVVKLPQILHDIAGVHVVPYQTSQPNFITQKNVSAELMEISYESEGYLSLEGKIIMVENADPGYDWLFSHRIQGLITKYGGVNSHMAIRCAEFGLPAAIGCGEQRYEQLRNCSRVQLDCAAGTLLSLY